MEEAPSQPAPSKSPEESAAIELLDLLEQRLRAAPTPYVLWRTKATLARLLRVDPAEDARMRAEYRQILDSMHDSVRRSGGPEMSDEEIDAAIREARRR